MSIANVPAETIYVSLFIGGSMSLVIIMIAYLFVERMYRLYRDWKDMQPVKRKLPQVPKHKLTFK